MKYHHYLYRVIHFILLLILLLLLYQVGRYFFMSNNAHQVYTSSFSFTETEQRIENMLKEKGMTIFAKIKFHEDAKKAGLQLNDEVLIIFGNPKAGTLLMQEEPEIGFDLPLKILIWQTSDHVTKVGYIQPEVLAQRYHIQAQHGVIKQMEQFFQTAIPQALTKS